MGDVAPYVLVRATADAAGLEPKSPSEWAPFRFRCPIVSEHGRSCLCADGLDGRAVLECERGCKPDAIAKAMGLTWRDIGPPALAPKPTPAAGAVSNRVAVWTRASDVQIRPVQFLWRPWLPLGKVTILAGAPGQGKSQLTAMLAAHTTRAAFMPGDVDAPGTAVIMTAEDDLDDTVVPRLMAANADLARVEFVNMRRTMPGGLTADGLIKLPGDMDTLQNRLEAGDVRLVVLDPVASFVGREHSTYVNQDVRDVLDPVRALAGAYQVAVVIVLHLNKSEAKTWALRIGESHAFQALARTVLALAPDPDDEDGEHGADKILAATKLNLARTGGHALKLRLRTTTVFDDAGTTVETSTLDLMGTSKIAADDLLADVGERGVRRDVLEFLLEALAAGPMESAALKDHAKSYGVSWRSVQRYYREVCKPAKPAKSRGPWLYELLETLPPIRQPGAHGGYRLDNGQSAPIAPGRGIGATTSEGASDEVGEVGEQSAFDLLDYRRRRDAMLGERWGDDE